MTDSEAWNRFLQSNFFGNPFNAWYDGEDVTVLKGLNDEECAEAEHIFLKNLPDTRMIVGFEELRSRKAIPELLKLINHQTAIVRIKAAYAIKVISGGDDGLNALIAAVLDQSVHWGDRYQAVISMGAFLTQQSADALVKALGDENETMRFTPVSRYARCIGCR